MVDTLAYRIAAVPLFHLQGRLSREPVAATRWIGTKQIAAGAGRLHPDPPPYGASLYLGG
jgi:hypothetical protein